MIEHRCAYLHISFSTNPGKIVCQSCKLESVPINVKPIPVFVPPVIVPRFVPREKKKYFCVCGKEKSKQSKHCMSCASALKRNIPPGFFKKPKEKKPGSDIISITKLKITVAEKNIERWKNMIIQCERMEKEKKEK